MMTLVFIDTTAINDGEITLCIMKEYRIQYFQSELFRLVGFAVVTLLVMVMQ